MIQVDFPAYALFMHKQNALRITTGNWPLVVTFSIINAHLIDINVFAKSDEVPSLPVQDQDQDSYW